MNKGQKRQTKVWRSFFSGLFCRTRDTGERALLPRLFAGSARRGTGRKKRKKRGPRFCGKPLAKARPKVGKAKEKNKKKEKKTAENKETAGKKRKNGAGNGPGKGQPGQGRPMQGVARQGNGRGKGRPGQGRPMQGVARQGNGRSRGRPGKRNGGKAGGLMGNRLRFRRGSGFRSAGLCSRRGYRPRRPSARFPAGNR